MICPVCNKPGLTENELRCPQCDSSLLGYKLIEDLSIRRNRRRKFKVWIYSFLTVLTLLNLILMSQNYFNFQQNLGYIDIQNNLIDSLRSELISTEGKPQYTFGDKELDSCRCYELKYIIKSGDNLSKVSRLFFNSERRVAKIISDNKLQNSSKIFAGDTLIIILDM